MHLQVKSKLQNKKYIYMLLHAFVVLPKKTLRLLTKLLRTTYMKTLKNFWEVSRVLWGNANLLQEKNGNTLVQGPIHSTKGIVHPKMKIWCLSAYPKGIQT